MGTPSLQSKGRSTPRPRRTVSRVRTLLGPEGRLRGQSPTWGLTPCFSTCERVTLPRVGTCRTSEDQVSTSVLEPVGMTLNGRRKEGTCVGPKGQVGNPHQAPTPGGVQDCRNLLALEDVSGKAPKRRTEESDRGICVTTPYHLLVPFTPGTTTTRRPSCTGWTSRSSSTRSLRT